jgi:hypothetical protein
MAPIMKRMESKKSHFVSSVTPDLLLLLLHLLFNLLLRLQTKTCLLLLCTAAAHRVIPLSLSLSLSLYTADILDIPPAASFSAEDKS